MGVNKTENIEPEKAASVARGPFRKEFAERMMMCRHIGVATHVFPSFTLHNSTWKLSTYFLETLEDVPSLRQRFQSAHLIRLKLFLFFCPTVPPSSALHHSAAWPRRISQLIRQSSRGRRKEGPSEDTCLPGKKKKKSFSFLLLSFLDTNQDEQAWPGGMTSPF